MMRISDADRLAHSLQGMYAPADYVQGDVVKFATSRVSLVTLLANATPLEGALRSGLAQPPKMMAMTKAFEALDVHSKMAFSGCRRGSKGATLWAKRQAKPLLKLWFYVIKLRRATTSWLPQSSRSATFDVYALLLRVRMVHVGPMCTVRLGPARLLLGARTLLGPLARASAVYGGAGPWGGWRQRPDVQTPLRPT